MMLATWLVEFYLSKCDELDDLIASSSALYDVDNVKMERSILEEDVRRFLESHKVGPLFSDSARFQVDLRRMTSNPIQYTN